MVTIHNLNQTQMLQLSSQDDFFSSDSFIHVSNVTKEHLLDTENILLYSNKTVSKTKILNFEKSNLIHSLNAKYKELFPNDIIVVSTSKYEEDNFIFKIDNHAESKDMVDISRLKIQLSGEKINLYTVSKDLSYPENDLSLKNFFNDKINIKALDIALKTSDFNIEFSQLLQYRRDCLCNYN